MIECGECNNGQAFTVLANAIVHDLKALGQKLLWPKKFFSEYMMRLHNMNYEKIEYCTYSTVDLL